MTAEGFNPQTHTTTTDIPKPRITILPDDEAAENLPPDVVKLRGSHADDEREEEALQEENAWGL